MQYDMSEFPPSLFLWLLVGICQPFNILRIGHVLCHHLIDCAPIGQSATITVVDEHIGLNFTTKVCRTLVV